MLVFMGFDKNIQKLLASLMKLLSATGEELSTLMPSIFDKAFKLV